jgi:hypothetical protein
MLVYALVDGYLLRNGIAPDVKQEAFMSPPSKRQWGDGERQYHVVGPTMNKSNR